MKSTTTITKNVGTHPAERAVFQFIRYLLDSGLDAKQLERWVTSALRVNRAGRKRGGAAEKIEIYALSSALSRWHRDRRYLDDHARPRAIPLRGTAPSIEALLRAAVGGRAAAAVLPRIGKWRLLAPAGKGLYRPRQRNLHLKGSDPARLALHADALWHCLQTMHRNLRKSPGERLLARHAAVRDLPATELDAFNRFSKRQAQIFLESIDDWLEGRVTRTTAKSRKGRRTAMAGVYTYAVWDERMIEP
ncbi:MAG: DUF6502 family protein [Steroidobacteraceae bacterium]